MTIRAYRSSDLTHLLQINQAGEPGVGAVSLTELQEIIAVGTCLVAVESSDQPIGFILLVPPNSRYHSQNYQWFEARRASVGSEFIYVDRIAIAAEGQERGLGKALYEAAFAAFEGHSSVITCEVNTEPPNPGSLRFHKRLGFVEIGQQVFDPGKKAVVYLERPL